MDVLELNKQIAKFKARRAKTRLAYYGTFISLFLVLSTLGSNISIASIVSFFMLLPLPTYFIIQSIKLSKKNSRLKEQSARILSTASKLSSRFSFIKFITQPGLSFRLTLILIILTFFTTIARSREQNASLTLNQTSLAINR